MLGNLLLKILLLPKEKLWVTVHESDDESFRNMDKTY